MVYYPGSENQGRKRIKQRANVELQDELKIKEIASVFNVEPITIRRWLDSGKLKDKSVSAVIELIRLQKNK